MDQDVKPKKPPGPNNPEKASVFVTELDKAVDTFAEKIHSYDRYQVEEAYGDFVDTYYNLLTNVEDYYKDASAQTVLDLVDDNMCTMFWMETE